MNHSNYSISFMLPFFFFFSNPLKMVMQTHLKAGTRPNSTMKLNSESVKTKSIKELKVSITTAMTIILTLV